MNNREPSGLLLDGHGNSTAARDFMTQTALSGVIFGCYLDPV